MTGIEKSVIIILFALVLLALGMLFLWVVAIQRDRKTDRRLDSYRSGEVWEMFEAVDARFEDCEKQINYLKLRIESLEDRTDKKDLEE